ncbi:MAG: heme exporter protein CcmB [Holophagales bacterium]|nr:heme exporter protein CcmB [Holophagales bacterium]
MMPFLAASRAVFVKDLRTEWRTRVALNALLLFAFSVLILVGYAVGPTRLSIEDRPIVNSVLLWIVLFFSAMTGLSRAFVNEEETGTALALRLSAPPAAVFLGKLLSNLALLGVVMAFVVPLFLGLMSFGIAAPGLFLAILVLGAVGLASASTFIAAIVAKTAAKGALFAVLATPLLLPPLVAAVPGRAWRRRSVSWPPGSMPCASSSPTPASWSDRSFLLFDAVWREAKLLG